MKSNSLSPTDIAAALISRRRKGQGLSVPYARKWEVGGCRPLHSLHVNPYDGISYFSQGLAELGRTLTLTDDALVVGEGLTASWVAINRSTRGEGPPDAYLLGQNGERTARYTGNAAEVVINLLGEVAQPPSVLPSAPDLQVGFPGLQGREVTYVGSWQWDVHGEARGDEFVRRAAVATLAAVRLKEAGDAS